MVSIAAAVDGQNVDDTYLNLIISKINRPPTCVVKRTGTLSITLNTDTIVTWQAEQSSDLDAMFDLGAATLLTAKTEGWYVLKAGTVWNSTTTTIHEMDILINGTTTAASLVRNTSYGATNGHGAQVVSPRTLLAVNDTIRLLVRTSATLSLQTSRGGTWLSAEWHGYGA